MNLNGCCLTISLYILSCDSSQYLIIACRLGFLSLVEEDRYIIRIEKLCFLSIIWYQFPIFCLPFPWSPCFGHCKNKLMLWGGFFFCLSSFSALAFLTSSSFVLLVLTVPLTNIHSTSYACSPYFLTLSESSLCTHIDSLDVPQLAAFQNTPSPFGFCTPFNSSCREIKPCAVKIQNIHLASLTFSLSQYWEFQDDLATSKSLPFSPPQLIILC